jgi:hypothetical protein
MVAAVANSLVDQTGNPPGLPDRKQVFARALEAKPLDPEALLADLQALARPASRQDIGEQLVIIVGCFPNAKADDAEIYGRMLAEYVADTNPSISDLITARDRLIKSLDFRPSIAEVLRFLGTEKHERQSRTERIEYFVSHPSERRRC